MIDAGQRGTICGSLAALVMRESPAADSGAISAGVRCAIIGFIAQRSPAETTPLSHPSGVIHDHHRRPGCGRRPGVGPLRQHQARLRRTVEVVYRLVRLGEGVVDEHTVIVGVDAEDEKGQLSGNCLQSCRHQGLLSGQHGGGFGPASAHVRDHQAADEGTSHALSQQWTTRSISRKPGRGRFQPANVHTGTLRPRCRLRRRSRRLTTVA